MTEVDFWRTFSSQKCEEWKQYFYLRMTGLLQDKYGFSIDLQGKSVLEIGAGVSGIVLRCHNGRRKIIEPAPYPNWVFERYAEQGVEVARCRVEDMQETGFDEVWVFNVLQHVDDLELAMQKIRNSAKVLRIFEYLEQATDELHKYTLTKEILDKGFGIDGKVTYWSKPYMYKGKLYYGVYDLTPLPVSDTLIIKKYGKHRAMCEFLREFYLSKVRVGAEIGTRRGEHAELLLKNLCLKKLYLIDPYLHFSSDTDTFSSWVDFERAKELTAPFKNIVQFIRLKSDDAFNYFVKNNIRLDFVYIDGDHSNRVFPQDFRNFYKITNYVIGGHDYLSDDGEQDWWRQFGKRFPNETKEEVLKREVCIRYELPKLLREVNITNLWVGDFSYGDWWIEKTI